MTISAQQTRVTDYIETTFLSILDEIQKRPAGHPKIVLKRIVRSQSQQINQRQVTYSWPGRTKDEAWRFTCVGKILADIYDALQEGVLVTKREIYYRAPELYDKQALVDRYVDDIAFTCGVTRQDLNVTASPKGLHLGLGPAEGPFEAVPDPVQQLQSEHLAQINWILIIEKEATFRYLAERGFHNHSANCRGLLVTAKGYPDLSTRRFLRAICDHPDWNSDPPKPVLGLFDADPDGINIMQVYRKGSLSLPHECAANLPEMSWVGLHISDTMFGVREDEAILKLSPRDAKKAVAMLARLSTGSEDESDLQCRVELQRMLMLNIKAETQILEDRSRSLEAWLSDKIAERH